MLFVLCSIYMVYYIDFLMLNRACIPGINHPRLCMLLDTIYYFVVVVGHFLIYIHKGYCSVDFLFAGFVCCWCQVNTDFIE